SSFSWVKVLQIHNICPYDKIKSSTVLPRKLRSFFKSKAFMNKLNFIKWRGYCGRYDALK
ncbi:glycosyltransferase family 2 protein, partial [Candidatus Woesearchaeota archaeon]|nr:glycosyltransferase family 2 protein [Candidatus Woesearchaeota archaeon]